MAHIGRRTAIYYNQCYDKHARENSKTRSKSASETVTGELTLRGQVIVDPSSGDAVLTLTDTNETN